MTHEVALPQRVDQEAQDTLLAHIRSGHMQEELCFALWRPATGATRCTGVVFEIVPPLPGERTLHGNPSFAPAYLTRSVRLAYARNAGLAFMHSHLTPGWQDMSEPDVVAERDRVSPPARATGYPLLGLTLGTDGSWSGRRWTWDGDRFEHTWCHKVRVVGQRLRITYHDASMPPPRRHPILRRTIDTWGEACQNDIARLRVGVVGVGSVGCMVAETLARMGVARLVLIDPDRIETHNLDRQLHARVGDVGGYKAEVAAHRLREAATAEHFDVQTHTLPVQHEAALLAALDCDLLFSAVDRPLPKDLVNRLAYAHCIPVISGGVFVDSKQDGSLGQAAWSVTTVGPGRRCLRCDGQYTTSDVVLERDGSLDDPSYVVANAGSDDGPTNQNVFPFSANLASFMVAEMVRLVAAADWWPDTGGKLHYSLIPNRLRTEQMACVPDCSICEKTAIGDGFRYPFVERDGATAGPKAMGTIPKILHRMRQFLKRGTARWPR